MQLSKPVKILVGLATAWLLVYPLLFMAMWLASLASFVEMRDPEGFPAVFNLFVIVFPLHLLTIVLQIGLMAFYLIHILKNTAASEVVRVILGVGVFFFGFVAMPVYYYLFIWRERPPDWVLAPQAEPATAPGAAKPAAHWNAAIVILIVALVLVPILLLVGLFGVGFIVMSSTMQRALAEPTPTVYTSLPVADLTGPDVYRVVTPAPFAEVQVFEDVFLSGYGRELPMALVNGRLLLAGSLGRERWGMNVDLVCADAVTGQVYWQAVAGSRHLAADRQRLYAEGPKDGCACARVAAYDLSTGALAWQRRLDTEYAAGLDYLARTGPTLSARTYNRGDTSFYALNPNTGGTAAFLPDGDSIIMLSEGLTYEWYGDALVASGRNGWTAELATERDLYTRELDTPVVLADLILVKHGDRTGGPVAALRRTDGALAWQLDQKAASNLAVGGPTTYFLTRDGQLWAVDTYTGEPLGMASFVPRLAADYDFLNDSLLAAAEGDTVAVYFGDRHQLSVLRFSPPAR